MQDFRSVRAALFAMMITHSVHAAVYDVAQRAPNASDEGPGSVERPWRTIAQGAQQAGAGDVVRIHDGIYRERVVIKTSGTAQAPIVFESAPGAWVVLSGADRLTRWEKASVDRPVYTTPWPHRFIAWSANMTHPDDAYHRLIGRCEQVAIENYLLRQVLDSAQLAPGTFYADVSNQVLHVWDPANRDLNKVFVEASVRQELLRVEGQYVQVRGLRFRYAANMAQHGAIMLAGAHDVLEDCVVESMNSSGATLAGADQVVRRCTFRDNGQIGFGANGAHRLLFTECLVENNNAKGFDRGWEAGGNKLVLSRDAVLERRRFVRNRGNGIWFDIGNEHCTVSQCLIADNEDAGIFYEISFGLQAHDNVIVGNGFAATAGAWGAQAGISLSSSPDCLIERDLIVGNREGFNFREQTRTTPRIDKKEEGPVWNHDQLIRNNIIAFNRDAQIWGWFDMSDDRHWPAGSKSDAAAGQSSPAQPLSLEKLNLRFEQNVYFAGPGEGWFNWGTTWGRHTNYLSLADFRSALQVDNGGEVINPGFGNLAARDFRLSAQNMNSVKASYPRGPIPGVLVGIRPEL
jgi:hypothetical protein